MTILISSFRSDIFVTRYTSFGFLSSSNCFCVLFSVFQRPSREQHNLLQFLLMMVQFTLKIIHNLRILFLLFLVLSKIKFSMHTTNNFAYYNFPNLYQFVPCYFWSINIFFVALSFAYLRVILLLTHDYTFHLSCRTVIFRK